MPFFLQQVDRFRELYLTEQEQKLDFESELKDCKVGNFCSSFCFFLVFSVHISVLSRKIMFFQINLESSNKALLDLQESYRLAISTLKEKEFIISKLLCSGKSTERVLANFCLSCCIFVPLLNYKCIFQCIYRKFFSWTCKGVTHQSAKCIRGYRFTVYKIRYDNFFASTLKLHSWIFFVVYVNLLKHIK